MSHMITATGLEYTLGPTCSLTGRPVRVEDIAHHLALINRFHGATSRPYSVAEHSLLVLALARQAGLPVHAQMAALLHDAHEAYTNDLASPAKWAVNSMAGPGQPGPWHAFEHSHAANLLDHFGLRSTFIAHGQKIRHLDLVALATERRDLTAWDPQVHQPWAVLRDGQPEAIQPAPDVDLNCARRTSKPWLWWRAEFEDAHFHLSNQLKRLAAGLLPTPTQGGTQ